jgi:hypothetical protein
MTETSINTPVGVTHIWPYSREINPDAQPFSSEREADVWEELRDFTLDDEVRGDICVALHSTFHDTDANAFLKLLQKDDVADNRVHFYKPREQKLNIRKAATEAWTYQPPIFEDFVDDLNGWKGDTSTPIVIPAEPGRVEVQKRLIPFHLGSKPDAEFVIKQHRNHEICALVLWGPDDTEHLKCLPMVRKQRPDLAVYIFHCDYRADKYGVEREGASSKEDYTFSTLPDHEEEDVLEHLLAKDALTMMPAPSYTGKTHTALSMGLSLVTGEAWLGKFKVPEKVRVRYFVPELSAGRFKKFMRRIASPEVWKQHEANFIVRPLECDLLQLDSEEMINKCKGCYVFLDTLGYFMGLDDNSSYTAAIEFAKRINHLIKEGCLGVCGLYHPPKYSKSKKETGNVLTLENQILGSAGFGGLLRSCIALRNLNKDSNEGLWCYVQGLKNPGLGKPFQIKGLPMEYLGESPYLSELLKTGSKKEQALEMLGAGKSRDAVCKTLGVSPNSLTKWKKEQQEIEFNPDEEETTEG